MDRLMETLRTELEKYAVPSSNGEAYLTENSVHSLFTIVVVVTSQEKRYSYTNLVVQVVSNTIIIEEERNSKPLYEALMQAGIPREQIILAYAGEPVPDVAG